MVTLCITAFVRKLQYYLKNKMEDEKLIQLVRNRPHLYDRTLRQYRDFDKREQAWITIGNELGMTAYEAQRRWRALRDRFNREKNTMMKRSAASNTYSKPAKKWPLYDRMFFIFEHLRPRESGIIISDDMKCDMPNAEDSQGNHVEPYTLLDILEDSSGNTDNPNSPQEAECVLPSAGESSPATSSQFIEGHYSGPPSKTRRTCRQTAQFTDHNQSMDMMHSLTHAVEKAVGRQKTEADSEQLFCESLVPRLLALPRRQRAMAHIKIEQVVFDLAFPVSDNEEKLAKRN